MYFGIALKVYFIRTLQIHPYDTYTLSTHSVTTLCGNRLEHEIFYLL